MVDVSLNGYAVPGGSASANFTTSARAQPGSALELLSVAQAKIPFYSSNCIDLIIYGRYIIIYAFSVPGGSASANFTTSARAHPGSALELFSVAQASAAACCVW